MTARNVKARIVKLEISRRTGDDLLLLWRGPDQGVDTVVLTAKTAGLFGPGDRVLCAEWFSDGEKPAARWVRDIHSDVTESEMDSLLRTGRKLAAVDGKNDGNGSDDNRSLHFSNEQLWYVILGVET
jgi:hypothetical protein